MKPSTILLPSLLTGLIHASVNSNTPNSSLHNPRHPRQQDPNTLLTSTITSTSTTLSSSISTTSSSSSATPTHPRNHNVLVGYNSTTFTPSTLKAVAAGDTLTFYFYPTNYSVIQSSFSAPCQPLSDSSSSSSSGIRGLYSGWNPTVDATTAPARSKFIVTWTPELAGDTVWMYAYNGDVPVTETQKSACEMGMSMVVNPGITVDGSGTLSTYRKRAAALRGAANAATAEWKGKLVAALAKVPGDGVWGGIVEGVSDKEWGRWRARHPWPVGSNGTVTGSGSGNGTAGDGNGDDYVANYTSGAGRRWDGRSGWVGVLAVLGAGVVGLGL